jgi:endoglucanase
VDAHILIDQFGYRPTDPKVAVIRTPKVGFDAAHTFKPGATYELHNAADNSLALSAALTVWNGGATQGDAGDAGWWFDFSTVTKPGSYYVYDPTNQVRSPVFPIAQTAYAKILKAAVHMYFYQRAGIAKTAPNADMCWEDAAAYLGPNQDSQAHDITDPTNAAKVRDMSGGWFDAGIPTST